MRPLLVLLAVLAGAIAISTSTAVRGSSAAAPLYTAVSRSHSPAAADAAADAALAPRANNHSRGLRDDEDALRCPLSAAHSGGGGGGGAQHASESGDREASGPRSASLPRVLVVNLRRRADRRVRMRALLHSVGLRPRWLPALDGRALRSWLIARLAGRPEPEQEPELEAEPQQARAAAAATAGACACPALDRLWRLQQTHARAAANATESMWRWRSRFSPCAELAAAAAATRGRSWSRSRSQSRSWSWSSEPARAVAAAHAVDWARVACWQSHVAALHVIASGDDPVLVLEDDVDCEAALPDLLLAALRNTSAWTAPAAPKAAAAARARHTDWLYSDDDSRATSTQHGASDPDPDPTLNSDRDADADAAAGDWDLLRVGGCFEGTPRRCSNSSSGGGSSGSACGCGHVRGWHVCPSSGGACTHAYVVRGPAAAARLLRALDVDSSRGRPLDLLLSDAIASRRVRAFSVLPPWVVQTRRSPSDITASAPVPASPLRASATARLVALLREEPPLELDPQLQLQPPRDAHESAAPAREHWPWL